MNRFDIRYAIHHSFIRAEAEAGSRKKLRNLGPTGKRCQTGT